MYANAVCTTLPEAAPTPDSAVLAQKDGDALSNVVPAVVDEPFDATEDATTLKPTGIFMRSRIEGCGM